MLKVQDINFSISDFKILENVSFEISTGKCVALLGPNGAGKSTLIDIITENLYPQNGFVKINGKKFSEYKNNIGVLYEYPPLFLTYKVKEILHYISLFYNVKKDRINELMNILDIKKLDNKLIRVLSKGERRKVSIILAIMHSPDFIILDEPTSGLDPFHRDTCWKLFKSENRTIFFSTHIWEEAAKFSDEIIFFKDGTILGFDSVSAFLSDKYIQSKTKIVVNTNDDIVNLIGEESFYKEDDKYYIYPKPGNFDSCLDKIRAKSSSYSILPIDLQDIYYKLTT